MLCPMIPRGIGRFRTTDLVELVDIDDQWSESETRLGDTFAGLVQILSEAFLGVCCSGRVSDHHQAIVERLVARQPVLTWTGMDARENGAH